MKRSYSFFVERDRASHNTLKDAIQDGMGINSWQCQYDHLKINQLDPYPKRGKFFKITYTLALKTGKWIVIKMAGGGGVFFNIADEELRKEVNEDFVNCLLHHMDWKKGTRFNRKVEVMTSKEIEK